MRGARIGVPVLLAVAIGGFVPGPETMGETGPEGPGAFEGTWSASGRRFTVPTEGGGLAGVVQVSGSIVLAGVEGLGWGFRGEAIGYDDGDRLSVGRAVWTDERGDRIFSRLEGERLEAGRRATGTFTGGTGRYAGLTGSYVFEWRYFVDAEDGEVHGLAVRLRGRARLAEPSR